MTCLRRPAPPLSADLQISFNLCNVSMMIQMIIIIDIDNSLSVSEWRPIVPSELTAILHSVCMEMVDNTMANTTTTQIIPHLVVRMRPPRSDCRRHTQLYCHAPYTASWCHSDQSCSHDDILADNCSFAVSHSYPCVFPSL